MQNWKLCHCTEYRVVVAEHRVVVCCIELAKEEQEEECSFRRRCGAVTPDGLIEDDFEQELVSPLQVSSM